MKVLFIGGTGIISSACTQLAVDRGIELYLLNRGMSMRSAPREVKQLVGDIRDHDSTRKALGNHHFDAIVDWVGFTTEHVETDIELFRDRTGQFVFISSASAYQTPPATLPVTESTLLDNPFWEYSRNKIACEERLIQEYRQTKFPFTIVRPSHTYDRTLFPMRGGYTAMARMRAGKEVIVHGDGSSLWTLTHHRDFAKGFVGLLGNAQAIGEMFHITSDEWLSWNQIFETFAKGLGVKAQIVHIPSEYLNAFDPVWGAGLLGDKTNSMIFDNSKIKRVVPDFAATIPFSRGAEEILAWYHADESRQTVDEAFDRLCDLIIAAYRSNWPNSLPN